VRMRKTDLQDLYGLHDISMGVQPKRVESGYAIGQLAEQDAEQQGLVYQRFLEMVRALGRNILKWVAYGYTEQRIMGYTNEDKRSVQIVLKSGKDIADATDVDLEIVGRQTYSHMAHMQMMNDAVQSGALTPQAQPQHEHHQPKAPQDQKGKRWESKPGDTTSSPSTRSRWAPFARDRPPRCAVPPS